MSQYTSTQSTAGGLVINAVLDTISNTITYTATAPNGASTTTTAPASEVGNSVAIVNALRNPLRTQGVTSAVYFGIGDALQSVQVSTTDQATKAAATATATGNPPPEEIAPIPVATAENPNPTPTPTSQFLDANAEPQQLIDPNTDPNTNIGAEVQINNNSTVVDDGSDPFVSNGTTTIERVDTNTVIDDGSDPYVSNGNTTIDTVTSPSSITENVFDPTGNNGAPQTEENVFDPTGNAGAPRGISTALNNTRSTATKDDSANFQQKPDWRARLSLAPNANYLYKVPKGSAGILEPLQSTDGVIFPYTPSIAVTYSAGYDASELIHSNYKIYQYKGSSVDTVSITADFTAQDTTEANYLLAVIHFFRSVTKMFYGQDQNPNNGVPPPLCYLSGFGAYTYDAHPLVVTNFTYTTPTDVDYIRAGSQTNQPGVNIAQQNNIVNSFVPSVLRTSTNGLSPKLPNFSTQNSMINSEATYVPTKLQLQITCIPIVTRNDISNKFSLKEYATGALLRGSKRSGGGIW